MRSILPLITGMGMCLAASGQSQREGIAPPEKRRGPFVTKEFRLARTFFLENGLFDRPGEVGQFFAAHSFDLSGGASVFYKPEEEVLIARNDQPNLDRIESIILEWHKTHPFEAQAVVVKRLKERIEKAEKLRPDQLKKVLQVLEIGDPSILKAVLRYETAGKNQAILAEAKEAADPHLVEGATQEKTQAFRLLVEVYDSVLKNQRLLLEIHERTLRELSP